jgi:hypothetical protein
MYQIDQMLTYKDRVHTNDLEVLDHYDHQDKQDAKVTKKDI